MIYREKLHPWAVVQLLPKMQRVVCGRFRTGSDANGHLRILNQHLPEGKFVVVFDPPILETGNDAEKP